MKKRDWIQRKIISDTAEVRRYCQRLQYFGKKVVLTNGCFDILHRGHLELLAQAAGMGDALIVALNTDASVKRLKGEERPVTHEQDRAFQLASLLCVDVVCYFDEDTPEQLIQYLTPDVLVKGGDYTINQIAGAPHVLNSGGQVEIIPIVDGYSTTSIMGRIKKL